MYYSRFINTLWRTTLSEKVLQQIEKELRRTKFGTRVEASEYCSDVTPPTLVMYGPDTDLSGTILQLHLGTAIFLQDVFVSKKKTNRLFLKVARAPPPTFGENLHMIYFKTSNKGEYTSYKILVEGGEGYIFCKYMQL